ncbi:hypothetical protein [Streptomyces sp. NBC_00233]|uniref:hypothetical protein n=1 Tax=Streptomyces sp. NBC_00233 TaxID=2975686 RepID=UPI00225BD9BC|nr:hypothetical protein [Streptomyces sp. NBC_00233]MCX5233030.1 hypothetical protein [Streptomyces sp. NBC_00233]
MTRIKKYMVAACAVTALAGVPTAAFAFASPAADSSHSAAVKAAVHTAKKSPAAVVAPGEKVVIAAGVKLWLTKDGKVCFQSLKSHPICNDAAGRKPGAVPVLLDEDEGQRAIIGGIFTGQGTPARMKAHTLNGAYDGTVVTLAGTPGWGAWYADAGITKGSPVNDMPPQSFLRSVAVYDTAGKTIAEYAVKDF